MKFSIKSFRSTYFVLKILGSLRLTNSVAFSIGLVNIYCTIKLFIIVAKIHTYLVFKLHMQSRILDYITCFIPGIFGLALLSGISQWLTAKTELKKKDYYGEYIVNRDYFPGRQADWQYENFRFEIKENDSIYFHVTDKDQILKTYRGTITTTKPFRSERLIIKIEHPTHHIMSSNPTTYRSAWSFYLVFYSPKFNNVYFKKGQWRPLDK